MALLIGFCYYSVFEFCSLTAQVAQYAVMCTVNFGIYFSIKTIDFPSIVLIEKKGETLLSVFGKKNHSQALSVEASDLNPENEFFWGSCVVR